MGQRELQKTSCRELSEKIQWVKKSIGKREQWLFPNLYGGINQSRIRERESSMYYGKRMVHTTQGQQKSREKEVWDEPEVLDDEFPDTVQNFIISSQRNQLHHFQKPFWISKHFKRFISCIFFFCPFAQNFILNTNLLLLDHGYSVIRQIWNYYI